MSELQCVALCCSVLQCVAVCVAACVCVPEKKGGGGEDMAFGSPPSLRMGSGKIK